MKTNKQNKQQNPSTINNQPSTSTELKNRTEHSSEKLESQVATETESKIENQNSKMTTKPYVNYEERDRNRQLPVQRVLEILRRWMPRQYELAEVVGKWIWITFPDQPLERVRAELSQLGFHWNNTRKCWQHPCGETLPRGQQEPREKYTSFFPADRAAA